MLAAAAVIFVDRRQLAGGMPAITATPLITPPLPLPLLPPKPIRLSSFCRMPAIDAADATMPLCANAGCHERQFTLYDAAATITPFSRLLRYAAPCASFSCRRRAASALRHDAHVFHVCRYFDEIR